MMEFGLRGAQEKGANAHARAAPIGGGIPCFNPDKDFQRVLDLIKFDKTSEGPSADLQC